ncbi:MAG TPA: YggS family pyridoxal phosphate-dependent enzyme [Firmicutes bacterium]|jgi:pyridoxal phosphate enzyme (YggS family)|nr:YggS family pyridoxal phosphate-dependent enzyme [Bacillota bacterium]
MGLAENLQKVRERVNKALLRAGGSPREVLLVAVTKTVGPEEIRALAALGVKEIGENRVQDAFRKQEALGDAARLFRWHMIGTLQRNKVGRAVESFAFIHSLDRLELALEINKESLKRGIKTPVLIQVNVAGEETKHGLAPGELFDFYREVKDLSGLSLQGLMTMAPLVLRAEEVRPVFARLRELHQEIAGRFRPGGEWQHLSMGMSNDFEVAVEEGATMIRVGSVLFQTSEEG